ncbi:MAG: cation-translocating P-type ATPase [Alphaproteobacteria bacterium]|nr:cation-translocating P-type ATPase [Alphaproteobacteria bacterium]MBP9776782.1 cation-translocating P-type ATPase [Alphaproteobacteria bacterium]
MNNIEGYENLISIGPIFSPLYTASSLFQVPYFPNLHFTLSQQFFQLLHLKAIAFDKTGTLTQGKPKVTDVINITKISKHDVLRLAASLEAHSEHPIASAILQNWQI